MSHVVVREDDEFTDDEWKKLDRLAGQRGKVYTKAADFLKDLEKI